MQKQICKKESGLSPCILMHSHWLLWQKDATCLHSSPLARTLTLLPDPPVQQEAPRQPAPEHAGPTAGPWGGGTSLTAPKESVEELFVNHIIAKAKPNKCWTQIPVPCVNPGQGGAGFMKRKEGQPQLFTLLDDVYSTCMWGDPHKNRLLVLRCCVWLPFPLSFSPHKVSCFPPPNFFKNNEDLPKQSPPIWLPWCISSPITSSASPFKEKAQKKTWQY